MPVLNLTHRTVAALKSPRGDAARLDYFDTRLTGFSVRVAPSGRKTWQVCFRAHGRWRRMSLGTYPTLSLADAREQARIILGRVARGSDPAAEKREQRRVGTFKELADEFLEKHAKVHKRSWAADERMITAYLLPTWKYRKPHEITRRDVRTVIDEIAARAPIMANRTLACTRTIFNYGLKHDWPHLATNPCAGVGRPFPEVERDRVLTADEIRSIWVALESERPAIRAIFRLRLLTAQRGGEVLRMRWLGLDLDNRWWTIPAEHAKNKKAHRVPLTVPVLTILHELHALVDEATDNGDSTHAWVFPSPRRNVAHISNVSKALDRIRAAAHVTFRGHDLRRTAASYMAAAGVSRIVLAKVLNHVERNVTGIYDRYSYDTEKRAALDAWARQLDAILKDERLAANIVAFTRG